MDAKRRAAIIKKIVSSKAFDRYSRFDPNYTIQNRVWFVTAVVDWCSMASRAPPTARSRDGSHNRLRRQFRRHARARNGAQYRARRGHQEDERKDWVRRVETIYGVLGENSALAKEGDDRWMRYRKFIARRRYRGLERMIHQVNPNEQGVHALPTRVREGPDLAGQYRCPAQVEEGEPRPRRSSPDRQ